MILELRLSNMFSLRDEMTLNLQAAKIQTQKARALEGNLFTVGGEQMLKSWLNAERHVHITYAVL